MKFWESVDLDDDDDVVRCCEKIVLLRYVDKTQRAREATNNVDNPHAF